MENIVASYKYPRKSPCEAKTAFFVLASRISSIFVAAKNFADFDEEFLPRSLILWFSLSSWFLQKVSLDLRFVEEFG